jgi:hypothetical protein
MDATSLLQRLQDRWNQPYDDLEEKEAVQIRYVRL